MSRSLKAVLFAALVLAGAMSLKTVVATHVRGGVVVAHGGAPQPPMPEPDPPVTR